MGKNQALLEKVAKPTCSTNFWGSPLPIMLLSTFLFMVMLYPAHLYFVFGNEAYSVYSALFMCWIKAWIQDWRCPPKLSSQASTCNLQSQPSLNTWITLNLIVPIQKSQRFRVLRGHERDFPLGGKVVSSYVVLLMVRGHIPHMHAFLLKCFFSVIWWVKFDKFKFTVNVQNTCCWYQRLQC